MPPRRPGFSQAMHQCRSQHVHAIHSLHAACGTDIDHTVGKLVGILKQAGKRETDLALCISLILLGIQYDDLSDTGYIDGRDEVVSIVEVCLQKFRTAHTDISAGAAALLKFNRVPSVATENRKSGASTLTSGIVMCLCAGPNPG